MKYIVSLLSILLFISFCSAAQVIVAKKKASVGGSGIAYLDASTYIQSVNYQGSQNISVHASTTLLVVGVSLYKGDANYVTNGSMTIGGSAMTLGVAIADSTSGDVSAIWYRINPPTGTQALAWTWDGDNIVDGGQYHIAMFSGVNTSSPVLHTYGSEDTDTSATTTAYSYSAGNMIFCMTYAQNTSNPTVIYNGSMVELYDLEYNGSQAASGYWIPAGNNTTATTATHVGGSGAAPYTTLSCVLFQ